MTARCLVFLPYFPIWDSCMERVHICMCLQTTMQKIAEIEAEVGAVAVCFFVCFVFG